MNKMAILETSIDLGDRISTLYPVILKDEKELILIDCGFANFIPIIKEAALKQDIELDAITKIIITHHDQDHIGSLAEFIKAYPNIKVLASAEQASYISGKKKSPRLQQLEDTYDSLSEKEKEGANTRMEQLRSVKQVDVDVILNDNEKFDWCGGIEIIPTSGHMPGHISVYAKEFKTLITGDALTAENGVLHLPNPAFTIDMTTAKESIKALFNYDIEKIVCFHGGICDGNVAESLKRILAE